MLQKILSKLRYKEYAVFFDEKGIQKDIKKLKTNSDKFKYNDGLYVKGRDKYNHFTIMKNYKLSIYYFYETKFSEPLPITSKNLFINKSGKPYIAEHLNTINESKVLAEINRKQNKLLDLDLKKVLIIGGVIVGIIYFLSGGSLA